MRFASPLLLSWEPQPEARIGVFYAASRERPFEAVAVPYPFRRRQPARPLEAEGPPLFQAVADLRDAAAALTFAVRFGLLFKETLWLTLEPPKKGKPQTLEWAGQALGAWLRNGAEMREALELWRAICEGDRAALEKVVSIVPGTGGRSTAQYRGAQGFTHLDQPLPRPSLTDAARLVLAWLVNQRNDAVHQLGYDSARPHKLGQILRPKSLLGAAWAQLAEHVGRDEARACPRCGRIFVVYLEAAGRRPEHCSDACRLAMHRRRKKAAARRKKA